MTAGQYNQYQQSAVEQAEPVKLVGMMYEGALRFIRRAEKRIADGDPEGAHNNIMRAYAIIAELMATLDFNQGGEIAVKLEQCYEYLLHLLQEANIKKDAAMLQQARTLIEPLLATWNDAFSGSAGAAPPIAPERTTPQSNGDLAEESPHAATATPQPRAGARKNLDVLG
jgi:flagellar protein FliS